MHPPSFFLRTADSRLADRSHTTFSFSSPSLLSSTEASLTREYTEESDMPPSYKRATADQILEDRIGTSSYGSVKTTSTTTSLPAYCSTPTAELQQLATPLQAHYFVSLSSQWEEEATKRNLPKGKEDGEIPMTVVEEDGVARTCCIVS